MSRSTKSVALSPWGATALFWASLLASFGALLVLVRQLCAEWWPSLGGLLPGARELLALFAPAAALVCSYAVARAFLEWRERAGVLQTLVGAIETYVVAVPGMILRVRKLVAGTVNGKVRPLCCSMPRSVIEAASRLAELDPANARTYQRFVVGAEIVDEELAAIERLQLLRLEQGSSPAKVASIDQAILDRLAYALLQMVNLLRAELEIVLLAGDRDVTRMMDEALTDSEEAARRLERRIPPTWGFRLGLEERLV